MKKRKSKKYKYIRYVKNILIVTLFRNALSKIWKSCFE